MSQFTIYRASAGSGKTYSLVIEYLSLALSDDSGKAYRKILGVTFTNKAATELKERILKFLKGIGLPENDKDFLPDVAANLCARLGIEQRQLAYRARLTYTDILHNYSRLSISTIDKFVHRLIRSFSRELGLQSDFEIEMDRERVFGEISRQLINLAGKDKEVTEWIIKWLLSKLDDNKSAGNYEQDLAKFGLELMTDEAAEFKPALLALDPTKLAEVQSKTNLLIKAFDEEIKQLAKQALKTITDADLGTEHFIGKSRGVVPFFLKKSEHQIQAFEISASAEKWFSDGKLTAEKGDILARVNAITPELTEIFQRMSHLGETRGRAYHFALLLRKQLYLTGFAAKMESLLHAYLTDKNLVLISDFNKKIASIVVNEPAPFIYELLGERYNHFLIDEFQDTSILQWQNFLPLVDNSLSKGGETLIVGDGKQSIYRFRGGEVEQFQQLPNIYKAPETDIFDQYKATLLRNARQVTIENNYRSSQAVVQFNNRFIDSLPGFLNPDFAPVFADGKQNSIRKEEGYVYVRSTEKEEKEDGIEALHLDLLLSDIHRVTEAGYRYKDCCILLSKNAWGTLVAQHLLENGIPILSEESLFVLESRKARLLLGCFQLLQDPASDAGQINVISNAISFGLIDLHEFDAFKQYCRNEKIGGERKLVCDIEKLFFDLGIKENLRNLRTQNLYSLAECFARNLGFMKKYDPFVQFFLDETLNRLHKDGNHLALYLNWWADQGQKAKVILPDGINAVRIMTIHKSKGLEFENVFLPMVCWGNRPTRNVLWVRPDEEFKPLEAALIPNSRTGLAGTGLEELNINETEKDKLDDANKLYVALTRAANNLFVYTDKMKTAGANAVCSHFINWIYAQEEFNEENQSLELGKLHPAGTHKPDQENKLELEEFVSNYSEEKLKISLKAPDLWEEGETLSPREFGNTLHDVLSKVNCLSDLELELDQILNEGSITEQMYPQIKLKLEKIIRKAESDGWMGSSVLAKNEMELVYFHEKQGEILRPDRVVFSPDSTRVIDYKTGSQDPKHKEQVKNYLAAISSLGYPAPKGLLVYIESGIEVEVES